MSQRGASSSSSAILIVSATAAAALAASWFLADKQKQKGRSESNAASTGNSTNTTTKTTTEMPTYKVFGVERKIDVPQDRFPTAAELEELEGGAILPGCEHGWYDSCVEGAKLHYRKFLPKSPKAVVIYQHGIHTHGGKAMVVDDNSGGGGGRRKVNAALMSEVFVKNNVALYAPDMYGHGYSEGTRLLIPDTWENNLTDLMSFVEIVAKLHPDVPLFLMGESYGGTLVIHAAKRYQDLSSLSPINLKGVMLTGPAIIGDLPPPPVLYVLRYVLAPRFPKWRPFFMPNPVSAERIWRDPLVLKKRADPDHLEMRIDGSGIPFRLGTGLNLILAMEEARKEAIPNFKQPYCLVHGTDDAGVPISGSDYMWETAQTTAEDKEYHRVEGAYHDMLADPLAEEVMDYFVQFIRQQLKK